MAVEYIAITVPAIDGEDDLIEQYLKSKKRKVELPSDPPKKIVIDPNMTLGEAIKKGIASDLTTPAWSDQAREKYVACISPHIDSFKFALEKLNREAQKTIILKHITISATA